MAKRGDNKQFLQPYFTKPKKGDNGKWYFQKIAGQGEPQSQSEPYDSKQAAYQGQIDQLKSSLLISVKILDNITVSQFKNIFK